MVAGGRQRRRNGDGDGAKEAGDGTNLGNVWSRG